MGFRYRKSINLGGGFRINLSKSGVGYSWGTKGYRITKTASGKTRRTYSIPGTGLSYVSETGPNRNGQRRTMLSTTVLQRRSQHTGSRLVNKASRVPRLRTFNLQNLATSHLPLSGR